MVAVVAVVVLACRYMSGSIGDSEHDETEKQILKFQRFGYWEIGFPV